MKDEDDNVIFTAVHQFPMTIDSYGVSIGKAGEIYVSFFMGLKLLLKQRVSPAGYVQREHKS